MKDLWYKICLLSIAGIFISMLLLFINGQKEIDKKYYFQDRAAYQGWVKYTNRTYITFEEWRAMRNANSLPQNTK